MKKQDKNSNLRSEEATFKKRYLLRKHEEVEAEKEIKEFEEHPLLPDEPRCPEHKEIE